MHIPINVDGCELPISNQLIQILSDELMKHHPNLEQFTDAEAITYNFRDPDYAADQGGYHPVEIRISRTDRVFHLNYLTDFSYVGSGWDTELAKEIDFDLVHGCCEIRYCKPITIVQSADIYEMYQENFISYYNMDVYDVEVALEC
jgi:hypothetical protein